MKAPGGSASFVAGDWFDSALRPGSFGIVYCRNSLRCSIKSYWRRSLLRFRELLSPRGVLLLETVIAIGIRGEVNQLIEECQFVPLPAAHRSREHKNVIAMWPTG